MNKIITLHCFAAQTQPLQLQAWSACKFYVAEIFKKSGGQHDNMQEMKRRETEILVHNVQFRTYMYVDRLLFSG